jgi:O-antigen/teichoic acid export membrane protein
MTQSVQHRFLRTDHLLKDLKASSIRSGVVTVIAQAVKLVVSVGSTVILARLLTPADYGLVGMAAVLLAFVQIFQHAGLSNATVQWEHLEHEQVSTLFWLNTGLGLFLALAVALASPLLASFYGEPRLRLITIALGTNFFLGGLFVQHDALLRRQMRFNAIVGIDISSLVFGILVAIVMARMGFGYWSLVGKETATILFSGLATCAFLPWRPGWPRLRTGIRPMLGFGGNIVGNQFLNTFVSSAPQMMLGRYAGAVQVGLYNKAYQLLMLPIGQVYGPVGQVVVPGLARVQSDPLRVRRFYLGVYGLAVSVVLPIVGVAAAFPGELIAIALGDQWAGAASIFRYLAIAGAFIAIMSPTGWFLIATGRTERYFKVGFVETPFVLIACLIGVRYGAEGLALAFAIARGLECPLMMYLIFRNTEIPLRSLWETVWVPFLGAGVAAFAGFLLNLWLIDYLNPFFRLCVGSAVTLTIYALIVLVVFGRWAEFRDIGLSLIGGFRKTAPVAAEESSL